MNGARRLFFAAWPDEATRAALVQAARQAVRGSGGRPVVPDNLHVTLAFLGSVAEAALPAVEAAGAAVAAEAAPWSFVFDGVEHWPRPRVLVATCSAPPAAAAAVAGALWARLQPLGLVPDLRPFRPHVTLARKVVKPAPGLALPPVRWPVTGLALVESVTDPAGARYRVIRAFSWVTP